VAVFSFVDCSEVAVFSSVDCSEVVVLVVGMTLLTSSRNLVNLHIVLISFLVSSYFPCITGTVFRISGSVDIVEASRQYKISDVNKDCQVLVSSTLLILSRYPHISFILLVLFAKFI
jgi:hypothetical protein